MAPSSAWSRAAPPRAFDAGPKSSHHSSTAGPSREILAHAAPRATARPRVGLYIPMSSGAAQPAPEATARHRVAIVGCGFGGLFAAKALRRAEVAVTVVERTNHHLFAPLLYQVATGILSPGEIAPAARDVLRRHRNVSVEMGEVTAIDVAARRLRVRCPDTSERSIEYDSLILAGGVTTSYFGNDGFARWAPGMKSIDDALRLRGRIFGAFEMAEWHADPRLRAAWQTFAIVGSGPTGVELAGQIGELAHHALRHNFRSSDPSQATILLFDAGERILPSFSERLSGKAVRALERLGVEIHTSTTVTAVEADSISVRDGAGEERTIPAMTTIWAAGVRASPLASLVAEATGAPTDRAGRISVNADCSVPGHLEIFVVGDMMSLNGLPGLAEVAMQTGAHAAKVIHARVQGRREPGPFRYRDLGEMAAVSRTSAVASFRGLQFSGRLGWAMWLFVHLLFLTGFKNRVTTVVRWTITFVGRSRAERTISSDHILPEHPDHPARRAAA
jgi:NADH dehydrogenase